MIRAVIDTNLLVTGFIAHPSSHASMIHDAWIDGRYQLVLSRFGLRELRRVLGKPYFRRNISPEMAEAIVRSVWDGSHYLPSLSIYVSGVADHWQDGQIISAALSGEAQYLMTKDRGLLAVGQYQALRIVGPREFCQVLGLTK